MYDRIVLSPSSVRDLSCGFKFRELRVLRRWPKQRSISTFAMNGRAAHAVFADLFNPLHGPCPPHRERLDVALNRAVGAERYPDDTSRRLACDWIRTLLPPYLDYHDPTRTVLAVEQADEFPFHYQGRNIAQVSARLDRIEVDDDDPETLIVVDLAFGQKDLTLHQVWVDLMVARHLYRDERYSRYRLEVHSIDSEGIHLTSWRGSDLRGLHLEIATLAAEFQAANDRDSVVAKIGEVCMHCPIKSDGRCPAQVPVNAEDMDFDGED